MTEEEFRTLYDLRNEFQEEFRRLVDKYLLRVQPHFESLLLDMLLEATDYYGT